MCVCIHVVVVVDDDDNDISFKWCVCVCFRIGDFEKLTIFRVLWSKFLNTYGEITF